MAIRHTYQPPLTHRPTGRGLILVLSDPHPSRESHPTPLHLDPPPIQKWAEEGFAVLAIHCSGVETWDTAFSGALVELKGKAETRGERFVYESALSAEIAGLREFPEISSMVLYLDQPDLPPAGARIRPQLRHVSTFGPSVGQPLVQDTIDKADTPEKLGNPITTYEYVRSGVGLKSGLPQRPSSFVYPSAPDYNHTYAALAHTRTLTFLRTHTGGPIFDIEAIWEAHTRFEFEGRDVDGTMATMVAEPYVNHIPTLTGGIGRTALTSFYTHHFIHSNPASTRMELVSRTIGPDRVVDEFIFEFVHDMEMDWMLPGVPPTGRHVHVPFVAVVNVRGDKLYHEHIYWDQASVLSQIGLLPAHLAFPGSTEQIKLPVVGVDQAKKMTDPSALESNLLIRKRAE
ncbi:carboxymethylenebutenolidase [Ceratobasidium sp. AG-Ba]|nr:carboxymethylenebutenolidase [Ceratobasidium sp. AG-Ba]QRW10789.1 carboxymethylenebutenolidase [Ceratobasidium sp. AG-Ba]